MVASLEGCTPPPDLVGGLEVEVVGWPDAIINEFAAGEGTIDAPCTVVAITEGGAPIDVDLDCGASTPPVLLRIGSDAQRFPLCVGEAVDLRYTRVEVGIPNGGGSERLELRRPGDDALLAASYRRFNADVPGEMAFAPFSFEEFDLGCAAFVSFRARYPTSLSLPTLPQRAQAGGVSCSWAGGSTSPARRPEPAY